MRETIYLRVSRKKVEGMTKSLPSLYRGEIPIKLTLEVKDAAFREPTIEREVVVEDWANGIELSDVAFEKNVITEKEAEQIRQDRLIQMKQVLESNGYVVSVGEA